MLYEAANSLGDLDAMGLLHITKLPQNLEWLTETHIEMLLVLAQCGEEGLPERKTRKLSTEQADALRMLELRDLVGREYDRFHKPVLLCLTWQGKETVQVVQAYLRYKAQEKSAAHQQGGAQVEK